MLPDPVLVDLLADAEPAARPAMAVACGEADTVARHLPAEHVPAVIRAVWLMHRAGLASVANHPDADALTLAALIAIDRAAEPMADLVLRAPDNPLDTPRGH